MGDTGRGERAGAAQSAVDDRGRADPSSLARPRPPGGPDLSRCLILIVDDEPINVRLLERILARAGFANVHGTTRSAEAASLFSELDPDLVLLDLHMPEPDGYAVMHQIVPRIPPEQYLPILVLTGDPSSQAKGKALAMGARDFVNKPFESEEVLLRIRNLLETRWLHQRVREHAQQLEAKVEERTRELRRAQHEALELLALASEYRDDDTGQHTRRVGVLSGLLAEELGLSAEEADLIRRAAPLHDVGKIGIPDGILLKPGPISGGERETMRRHTDIGSSILSRSSFRILRLAAEIAACHHEWWDGSGYPAALRGEEIPLTGRIVALADVFDSLTHARPYKRAWSVEEAVREIEAYRGVQFDPAVVDAFRRLQERGALDLDALNEAAVSAVYPLRAGADAEDPGSAGGADEQGGGA